MRTAQVLAETYGLTIYEARIYIELTLRGPMLIAKLSSATNIPRTAIYPPLMSLLKKGLVARCTLGKRTYYEAGAPEILRDILEKRREQIDAVIASLNESRRVRTPDSNLDAVLHVGIDGIKTAGLVFLNETVEDVWYSFENLALVTDAVGVNFEDSYIRERVARNIKSKMILSVFDESAFSRNVISNDKEQLRDTILLSPNQYPFETTVVATEGLILLIQPHDNPYALLLRNGQLASTFISIHRCIWDRYRAGR